MQVVLEKHGRDVTAHIAGMIDTTTSAALDQSLREVAVDQTDKLTLDFAEVEYITSAGLRVLLIHRKRFPDDRMELIHVSPNVNEIFATTGFDKILSIQVAEHGMARYLKQSLKEFLAEKAMQDADRAAISFDGDIYTWADVERCAQIIAKDLQAQGVGKGTHVGLMGMNSANWILTFFAIQKLNAIALLINFNLKASEIQSLSKIGDITHLCYGELADMGSEEEFKALVTDEEKSLIRHTYSFANTKKFKERADEYPALAGLFLNPMLADDPAVMLFTSGSTGKPKAVLLSAYNILNSSIAFAKTYHLGTEDIVCQILPMFHVLGMVCSLFGNMIAGGSVVIPKDNHVATILDTIQKEKCTQLYSVPTLLLAIVANKNFDASRVSSLKCIMMGGAAVTAPQLEMLGKCFPGAFLATGYGLSEMAPVSLTGYKDSSEHVTKTVGKPMDDLEVCIADVSTHEKLPQGQSGEVLVRGYNNMVCYYHLALDDQPIDDEGWIHTGDLGLLDEDGYIRLVGRAKELIIRGGENIAPGEIQEVISQFPDVADVKVQGVPDDFYGEVVGASIVMKDHKPLDADALRQFLSTRLAKYKIPKFIFQYDAFPVLSNGKIDAVSLKKDMNAKAKEMG